MSKRTQLVQSPLTIIHDLSSGPKSDYLRTKLALLIGSGRCLKILCRSVRGAEGSGADSVLEKGKLPLSLKSLAELVPRNTQIA